MSDLSGVLRSERLAFVEFLGTLQDDHWQADSLCEGWTVQDVAAHLAWMPVLPPHHAAVELVRARFNVNRLIADTARRWSARGRAEILAQLRRNAEQGAKPVGVSSAAALVDAVVHPLDVRRPLGRPRQVPAAAFVPVANFLVSARWPITMPLGGGVRRRVQGLRLVAEDVAWSHGSGREVRASSESLILFLAGRAPLDGV